jgi:hypothetical protein
MPVIRQFGGLVPRLAEHLKAVGLASRAHNVDLADGSLRAWREPRLVAPSGVPVDEGSLAADAIIREDCLSAGPFLPDDPRVFYVLRGGSALMSARLVRVGDKNFLVPGGPVGAPLPPGAISCVPESAPPADRTLRCCSYVYTLTNEDGDESPPSEPSNSIAFVDGGTVRLVFPDPTLPGIRVYRSVTGSRTGAEDRRLPQTAYFEVEVDPADGLDALDEIRQGAVLATADKWAPPVLESVRHLGGTGALVGHLGNRIYFSESFEPDNWPEAYELTLPDRIVALDVLDSRVLATTEGGCYVVDGAPDCDDRQAREVADADHPTPDLGRHRRSATATPFGLVFASPEGLSLLTPEGRVQFLTLPWMSGRDFLADFDPETFMTAYWRGRVVFTTRSAACMLEVDNDSYKGYALGALTTQDLLPGGRRLLDMAVSRTGELLLLASDGIWQFDAGDRLTPYEWESADLALGCLAAPSVGRAVFRGGRGAADFSLVAPPRRGRSGRLSWSTRIVGDRPFRMARLGRRAEWRAALSGTSTVERFLLGTSLATLEAGL